ncbi:MAG: 2-amino-4-hydroxy-6-hydroxymethyldihydropteridine diphosphokinase [Akkermansia sp.]
MKRAGIALGSNMGAKLNMMRAARDYFLEMHLQDDEFLQSCLYMTEPVGCPAGSDCYVNAVLELTWAGTAEDLLVHCQSIERDLGRVRSHVRCEPRTADVDILYLGDLVVNTPRLTLPHPRAHLRKFVLRPLLDIRPELILPGQTCSVAQLLQNLQTNEPEPVLLSEQW